MGLEAVSRFWPRSIRKFLVPALLGVFVFGVAPTSWEAALSSKHILLEETRASIKKVKRASDSWLFSTYWPNFFSRDISPLKVAWLADSFWETSAFMDSNGKSSLDVLRESGGLVVVESLYSSDRRFKNPTSRLTAREFILGKAKPSQTIIDNSPNFPHYRVSDNRIDIYSMDKGRL